MKKVFIITHREKVSFEVAIEGLLNSDKVNITNISTGIIQQSRAMTFWAILITEDKEIKSFVAGKIATSKP